MKRRAFGIVSAALAVAFAIALAACGAQGAQPTEPASSTGIANQESATQALSAAYLPVKTVVNGNDEWAITKTFVLDDRGKTLEIGHEVTGEIPVSWSKFTVTEWDEQGRPTKGEYTAEDEEGNAYQIMTEVSSRKLNEDGSMSSEEGVQTTVKDSFKEGEIASTKYVQTVEYGNDIQTLRKLETRCDLFDQSGALIESQTFTKQYDENGLETFFSQKSMTPDGAENEQTCTFEWTKDEGGKVAALKATITSPAATVTLTADVEADETGRITKIHNISHDGTDSKFSCAVEYTKVDNPLLTAYEGWKSFPFDELLFAE